MITEIFKGNWHQIKGKIIKKWGSITNDDIACIKGNLEELRGLLQKRYNYTKAEAQDEIVKFCNENNWT